MNNQNNIDIIINDTIAKIKRNNINPLPLMNLIETHRADELFSEFKFALFESMYDVAKEAEPPRAESLSAMYFALFQTGKELLNLKRK